MRLRRIHKNKTYNLKVCQREKFKTYLAQNGFQLILYIPTAAWWRLNSSCWWWPANQMNCLGNMVTALLMQTGTLHCYFIFSKLLYCSESVQIWIVSYRDLNRLAAVGDRGFGRSGGGQKSRPTVQEPGRSIDWNWKLELPVAYTVVLISQGFDFRETLPYLGNSYNVCVTIYTDSYILIICLLLQLFQWFSSQSFLGVHSQLVK